MSARRHRGKRHSRPGRSLLVRLVGLLLIAGLAWWAITLAINIKQKIGSYSTKSGHAFISLDDDHPTLLLIEQGQQPDQLASIAVVKVDSQQHRLAALKLPVSLSDGQTTAAEYLESGYYKELQQMVEQTLALPLSGYIIQPRQEQSPSSGQKWSDIVLRQPRPGWWQTTLQAPWWLGQQPTLKTSLSAWQLAQVVWLARDADDRRVTIEAAPAAMFHQNTNNKLVADVSQLDEVVSRVFVNQKAVNEGVSVVVKNATNVSGLAGLLARYIKHLGGEVIAVEVADTGQVNSSMKGEKPSLVSQSITGLIGIPLTATPRTGRERADLEVIIGVDTLGRVGQPVQ